MRIHPLIVSLLFTCASFSPLAAGAEAPTNLGSVNVTSSSTTMVKVVVPSGGKVSNIAVVTQGVPNADFTDAGGGSCSVGSNYSANATCTVNVKFTPAYPGTRYGAVVLSDANGVFATQLIQATGIAPEAVVFPSVAQVLNVAEEAQNPSAIAVDPAENLYFADIYFANNADTGKVWLLTSSSMYQTATQIGSGFGLPLGVALDGIGNVYVADGGAPPTFPAAVYKETISNGTYIQSVIASGFIYPGSIAVDGSGNVYVADAGMPGVAAGIPGIPGGVYKETLTDNGYTQTEIGTGIVSPSGVAVDASGNVYISDDGGGVVYKETPNGGSYNQTTISKGWSEISRVVADAVGNLYVEAFYQPVQPTFLYRESPFNGGYLETKVNVQGCTPLGVAIEGSGNLFVVNQNCEVLQISAAAATPLSFEPTAQGTTSYESPQKVTVSNMGNAPLDISSLSFPEDFPEVGSATGDCKSGATLQPGAACDLTIDFSPTTAVGSSNNNLSESVDLTTNSLNATTQQAIAVSGTEYPPAAAMAVNVSADPSIVGNPVIFTATVTGSTTVPTGTVTFSSGTTLLATIALSSGVASYSTTFPIGSYSITVAYSGDSKYLALNQTIVENIIATPPLAPIAAVNFQTVDVGATSASIPVTVTFNTAETLGSVAVLTQGAAGLDFTEAGGGTCTPGKAFAANATCTVNTLFKPKYSGPRYGAVALFDSGGKPLGYGYLQGTGQSAHATFSPGNLSLLDMGYIHTAGLALDGSGNLYVVDGGNIRFMGTDPGFVYKETRKADGTYSRTKIGSGLLEPWAVAVDGAGNVYIADGAQTALLKETLQTDGSYVQSTVGFGLQSPNGVAVDGAGNAFVASPGFGYILGTVNKETFANGGYVQTQIGTGLALPNSVAVDGSGNVYISDGGLPTTGSFLIPPGVYKESPSATGYDQTPIGSGWGLAYPNSIAVDDSVNVYVLTLFGTTVVEETPQANGSYVQSTPDVQYESTYALPGGLTFDGRGSMYIDDNVYNVVYLEDFGRPPSLTFGPTNEDFSSVPQIVTVTNSGNAALAVSSIVATENFAQTNTCGSSIPPQGTCTISVTFTPASTGTLHGAITITSNSIGSPQTMDLTGTGTSTAAGISFSPANLTFSPLPSGSTSSPQTITVTNPGSAPLTISSVKSQYNNYAETNTCTASIAPGGSCTISVVFTPRFGGTQEDNLIVTDNAAGSPQSIPLLGDGSSVYFVVSPPALTIAAPGGSATENIQVSSDYGFSGNVSLACQISYQGMGTATDPPACTFSPGNGQVTGASSLSTTLSVSTTAAVSSAAPQRNWMNAGAALAFLSVIVLVPRRRRKLGTFLGILAIAAASTCLGCGGGGSGGGSSGGGGTTGPPSPGTTPGTYQIVVTATSGTVSASTTIALTLQ